MGASRRQNTDLECGFRGSQPPPLLRRSSDQHAAGVVSLISHHVLVTATDQTCPRQPPTLWSLRNTFSAPNPLLTSLGVCKIYLSPLLFFKDFFLLFYPSRQVGRCRVPPVCWDKTFSVAGPGSGDQGLR